MSIHLDAVLQRGGKGLLELMHYCVMSVQPEPLFVWLVREYRQEGAGGRALALYDVFCARRSSARPGGADPRAVRLALAQAIDAIRRQAAWAAEPPAPVGEDEAPSPRFVSLPPAHLFDAAAAHLLGDADGPLARIAHDYDPERTPLENLAGGKMNASQRFFVENVWRPRLRPQLVAAGFWRIATVGG